MPSHRLGDAIEAFLSGGYESATPLQLVKQPECLWHGAAVSTEVHAAAVHPSPSGSSALTNTAAWVRLWHSSFFRIAVTCTFTVFSARPSS